MSFVRKAVFFFCTDADHDPVAPRVLRIVEEIYPLNNSSIIFDGNPVLEFTDEGGNIFLFARTRKVLSHAYPEYLPALNEHFGDCSAAGVVNWHEGANAPDKIIPVHSTCDIVSGIFGNTSPLIMRNLLVALEKGRRELSLDDFTVYAEGSHWSGVVDGTDTGLISEFPVPVFDIEIGSSPSSWEDARAARVIAGALPSVFEEVPEKTISVLCVGGMHFEPTWSAAVLSHPEHPCMVSHVLPNHWYVEGGFDGPQAFERLDACLRSISGGVQLIAFHDNLKGAFKAKLKEFGEQRRIPVVKHRALRNPESVNLW